MKRSPIKRKTRLRRKPRSEVKRPPSYDDPAYLRDVAALPCCCPLVYHGAYGTREWRGEVVAHHPRLLMLGAGAGLKCPYKYTIPMASKCHDDLHNRHGAFQGWSDEFLAQWQIDQGVATERLVRARRDAEMVAAHVAAARTAPF